MFVRVDDRGLTLTEVLVSIVIIGIIIVPLGNAMIGFLKHSDSVSRRLDESHDVQIAAAYFAQDVQSIGTRDWAAHPYPLRQSVELNAPATGGLYPCGVAGTPDAVVRFAWDDPADATGPPTVVRVAYVVSTVDGERRLRRLVCTGSGPPASDVVLAHNVDNTLPTVACSTSCTAAPDIPQTVTLTLRVRDPASDGPALIVVLSGQRRQT
jgi:prepilin-type N-terminal cleavage/methylation domain-containing protein